MEGVTASTPLVGKLNSKGEIVLETTLDAANKVKLWSAEAPYRYTLVGELKDAKGRTVQTFSTIVGFRKVEIKETPAEKDEFGLAGRYYYLNGQPIKLKGVNRHENNTLLGHTATREQMENEIFLMKRGNINMCATATILMHLTGIISAISMVSIWRMKLISRAMSTTMASRVFLMYLSSATLISPETWRWYTLP